MLFFNPDISRQPPDPVQFVMKKINDHPCNNHKHPGQDDIFPGMTVHAAKINSGCGQQFFDQYYLPEVVMRMLHDALQVAVISSVFLLHKDCFQPAAG